MAYDKDSNAATLFFAVALCVVLALCLASTYNGLKPRIDANVEFDRQRNVLLAVGLYDRAEGEKSREALEELYATHIVAQVLERRDGGLLETDLQPSDLLDMRPAERERYLELFRAVDAEGDTTAWCIPISGKGLWSTLYGFLALRPDLDRVQGITFYKHGETPGLGAEVDNPRWQAQWRGKHILDDQGDLVGITVKKGHVDPSSPREEKHFVDGLSGATITSKGVMTFVKADLETYEPYFRKHRQ